MVNGGRRDGGLSHRVNLFGLNYNPKHRKTKFQAKFLDIRIFRTESDSNLMKTKFRFSRRNSGDFDRKMHVFDRKMKKKTEKCWEMYVHVEILEILVEFPLICVY